MSDEFSPMDHIDTAAAQPRIVDPMPGRPTVVALSRAGRRGGREGTAPAGAAAPADTVVVDTSAAPALTEQARAALAGAALVVDSDLLLSIAAEDLKAVKALQHEVETRRTAITAPLNEALRRVNELFRAPKQYLDEAETAIKSAMLAYTSEQERIASAAREQAEREGQRQRAMLAAQALEHERQAQAAEREAQASAAAAAAAQKAGDWEAEAQAQQTLLEHLERAEQARRECEQLQAMSCVVTVPCSAPAAPRLEGITGRVTYAARVVDLTALIQAVAAGHAPAPCVQANEKFLAAQARAHRRVGTLYPGVEVAQQRGLAATRSR